MPEQMFKTLSIERPYIADDVINYYPDGYPSCLVLELKDGRTMFYDSFTNSLRPLPNDKYNMTREECCNEFGSRLKMILIDKGISQRDLSDMTGISRPLISTYVNGLSAPSFHNADKIAKALDISMDRLRYW